MNDLERIDAYIAAVEWRFAKSMPSTPHWYTLKANCPDLIHECEFLAEFIRRNGYVEELFGRAYTYYDFGSYQYLSMGEPIGETILINRAELVYRGEKEPS